MLRRIITYLNYFISLLKVLQLDIAPIKNIDIYLAVRFLRDKIKKGLRAGYIQPGWVIPDLGICSMRVYLSSSLPPPTV